MSLLYLLLFAVAMALIGMSAAYFIRRANLRIPARLNVVLLAMFLLFYPALIFILPLPYLMASDYYILLTLAMLGTGVLFINLGQLPSRLARLGGGILLLLVGGSALLFILLASLYCDVAARRWVLGSDSRVVYLSTRPVEEGQRLRVYQAALPGASEMMAQGVLREPLQELRLGAIEGDSCCVVYGEKPLSPRKVERITLRLCGDGGEPARTTP